MKKNVIFLILITIITITGLTNVKAYNSNFYEAEYIDGIWMNKRQHNSNTIYFQKARFFRQYGTNNFAYCIEPFTFFNESSSYESTFDPYNLSNYQKERIAAIAHFGYGYKNHMEPKWYAITQFMIWQIAEPNSDFYFTDSLNGNRVSWYQNEINEINYLISNYETLPSIASKTYQIVENNNLIIKDTNNVLNNYIIQNNQSIKIKDNHLIFENPIEGTYELILSRTDNFYNKPIIFYQSSNSQNLVETGDINNKTIKVKIDVVKTNVNITKVDQDTNTTTPSGDALLEGATYELYDSSMNKINTITINQDKKATIENLNFGKYYIKEIEAGIGYEVDENIYSFEITTDQKNIELTLKNKVIEADITINKLYGDENNFSNEPNINFNIYNKNNEFIKTITTNEQGVIKFTLPYGSYLLNQITTTEGYKKIEPFIINITNRTPQNFILKNYKIKVPNTRTSTKNLFIIIIKFIRDILC